MTQERIRKQAEELGKKLGRLEGLRIGEKRGERKGKREGIEIGQKRGMEKGIALGELQGIDKNRRQVASELKRLGVDRALILKSTGISEEELDSL